MQVELGASVKIMDYSNDSQPVPQTHQQETDFNQTVIHIVQQYMKSSAFSDRKLTDTPTDSLSVVNRAYVTMNGTNRPTSSVIGQSFFDTTLASGRGKLITWNGTGFVDGNGTYV